MGDTFFFSAAYLFFELFIYDYVLLRAEPLLDEGKKNGDDDT